MANIKFTNFARAKLTVGIGTGTTSFTITGGSGVLFPALTAGQYFYATLENAALAHEIVKVTARATDTLTVVRAQDGTTALAWNAGDTIALRFTAAAIADAVADVASGNFTGNLSFIGAANRITGDFSNATLSSRVLFQTSTVNGSTAVGVIPNGSASQTQLILGSNQDSLNSNYFDLTNTGAIGRIRLTYTGAGNYLPMTFDVGGAERMRIKTTGEISGANFDALNGGQLGGFRNRLINGGMQVGQRGAVVFAASADKYGWVDRWIVRVTGTTVSALGYQTADVNANSGISLQVGNVTTTGASSVAITQRIEAANCQDFGGKTIVISGKVRQMSGSPQTLTVYVNKANAPDNFGAITPVGSPATGTFVAASGAVVPFSFTTTLGSADAVNGLQVTAAFLALPALSSIQFLFSDMQLELGSVATPFEQRPYGIELALCQRYYQKIGQGILGLCQSTTSFVGAANFASEMRIPPAVDSISSSIVIFDGGGNITQSAAQATFSSGTTRGCVLIFGNYTGLTQFRPALVTAGSGTVNFSAEL